MNTYQQPDFTSAKIVALCQRHQITILRLVEPALDRGNYPDRPLDLIAEFKNPLKVKPSEIALFEKELASALSKPVKVQHAEEMTRHARFAAIAGSKVVYT